MFLIGKRVAGWYGAQLNKRNITLLERSCIEMGFPSFFNNIHTLFLIRTEVLDISTGQLSVTAICTAIWITGGRAGVYDESSLTTRVV